MKEDLIAKLLNEQTTPEEEHQIAQLLRPSDNEMAQWLAEDETAAYDQMVSSHHMEHNTLHNGEHHAKRHALRWAAAAVVTILLTAGAFVLWTKDTGTDTSRTHSTTSVPTPVTAQGDSAVHREDAPIEAKPRTLAATPRPIKRAVHQQAASSSTTADSLQIYIERLERELAQVTDSSYTTKAEQIIRADARLQRLVQRIMMGEITRNSQPMEAINSHEGKEDLP